MPDLPTIDIIGLGKLFTIILSTLGVFWGINKAILMAKH